MTAKAEHEVTLWGVRNALVRMLSQELMASQPDESWLKALVAAWRTVKKLA